MSVTGMASNKLPRTWIDLQPSGSNRVQPSHGSLRVLQWNILADGLAQAGDFIRVDPAVLEWPYRLPLILAELQEADADVICLQEVNRYEDLASVLRTAGYEGFFFPKLMSPAAKYHCPSDGTALFWRTARLRLQHPQAVQGTYFEQADKIAGCAGAGGFVIAVLQDLAAGGRSLLVASTHLKAKEGAALELVRVKQMEQLLKAVGAARAAAGAGVSQLAVIPVIITGDLNDVPSSPVCQVLKNHELKLSSIWDVISACATNHIPDTTSPGPKESSQGKGHPVFTTAASDQASPDHTEGMQGMGAAPAVCDLEFSTWKYRGGGESRRTIDHMWWVGLQPVRRWKTLSRAEIGPSALPCAGYASDHVALCVDVLWDEQPV